GSVRGRRSARATDGSAGAYRRAIQDRASRAAQASKVQGRGRARWLCAGGTLASCVGDPWIGVGWCYLLQWARRGFDRRLRQQEGVFGGSGYRSLVDVIVARGRL